MKKKPWRKKMLFLFMLCFTTFLSFGQQFTQIGNNIDGEEANNLLGFDEQVSINNAGDIIALGSQFFAG